VKFYRRLVTVLPGQGYQTWTYNNSEKKAESWPLLGWAVYREVAEAHECDLPNYCECEGDDYALVVPLSAYTDGSVEEAETDRRLSVVNILPAGVSCSDEEAAALYEVKRRDEAEGRARRAKEATA
jgi:hypothetical protein